MAKIKQNINPAKTVNEKLLFSSTKKVLSAPKTGAKNEPFHLDTLAQLRHPLVGGDSQEKDVSYANRDKIKLQKRARSKYITDNLAIKLAELHSPLEKYYRNAFYCNNTLLQNGRQITAKYCNTRICNNCNRIRTGKLINGYLAPLQAMNDPQFVTLTIPNCPDIALKDTILNMMKVFVSIKTRIYNEHRRKETDQLKGIRKLEVTYNAIRNDYHPHFHCIIEGLENAIKLRNGWLKAFPLANIEAQNIKPADEGSMIELFKYVTKIIAKSNGKFTVYVKAIDTIMKAVYRMRTFQNYGGIRKVSEDVDDIDAQTYECLNEYDSIIWEWDGEATDWVDEETGEVLTGYKPSKNVKTLVNSMK